MDGAKNAMYAQAGRNHSWSKVQPVTDVAAAPRAAMPEPPVVEVPDFAGAVYEPRLETKPHEKCQELAMVYMKTQKWQELYEPDHGFTHGTIFSELDLPFAGKGACKGE